MNYTKNYRLPQWVKSDRIMMEDFNSAMASMENGMTSANSKADLVVSTANTAQQTAGNAQTMAQQISGAAYTPSNKPYVVGSYTGAGQNISINLGFRPSFLIISGMRSTLTTNSTVEYDRYHAITAGNVMTPSVKITATGFTAYVSSTDNGFYYPTLTESGRVYDYIAFK